MTRTTYTLLGVLLALGGTIYAADIPYAGLPSTKDGSLWARKNGTTNTKQDLTSTSNALDVNIASGTVTATPTGTQDSNTKQVNGVTTSTGSGAVGTGSQRVAVGTDTATIAGSAPGTDGTQSANYVSVQGAGVGGALPVMCGRSKSNLSASTNAVKSGAGNLCGIFVASSTSCTLKLWDNTTQATTILVNTFSASAATWYPLPFAFATGLSITIGGTCDFTVSYN